MVEDLVLRESFAGLHERGVRAYCAVRTQCLSTRLTETSRVDGVSHRLNEHTKKLDYYTGNYDSYVRERSIRDDEQQRKYDAEQRDIAEIKDFIAR